MLNYQGFIQNRDSKSKDNFYDYLEEITTELNQAFLQRNWALVAILLNKLDSQKQSLSLQNIL